jgi:hypothetical protein
MRKYLAGAADGKRRRVIRKSIRKRRTTISGGEPAGAGDAWI